VKRCSLENVRKMFSEPDDLLRWEVDGVDSDHRSLVDIALHSQIDSGHNLEVLDHLLNLSPKYFMQQMSMTSGGYRNLAPLGNLLSWALNETNIPDVLAVVQWLCRSGIMTDTLFNHCASDSGWGGEGQREIPPGPFGIRPKTWKSAVDVVREHGSGISGIEDVIAELEHWQQMSPAEKRQLTEQRFESLLRPALSKKKNSINNNEAGSQGGDGGEK